MRCTLFVSHKCGSCYMTISCVLQAKFPCWTADPCWSKVPFLLHQTTFNICFSALKDMCGHSNTCLCFKKRCVITATLVFALRRDKWSQQQWSLLWQSPTCTLHKGGRSNQGTIPPGESAVRHFLHPDDSGTRSSKDPPQDAFPQILLGITYFCILSQSPQNIDHISQSEASWHFQNGGLCHMKTNLPSLMLWIHEYGTHLRRTTTTGTELARATSLLSVK